jgi:hypothetical protein
MVLVQGTKVVEKYVKRGDALQEICVACVQGARRIFCQTVLRVT